MPVDPFSAAALHPLLPLRKTVDRYWETILTAVVAAPDPALAAANLSRLLEHGPGNGTVFGSPDLCLEFLFLLGSSQHLATVLFHEEDRWEEAFLADRQSSSKSVAAHLATLRSSLALDSSDVDEDEFLRGLRRYRNREQLRIGTRDLLVLATLEETIRDLSHLAEAIVQVAYEHTRAKLRVAYGEAEIEEAGRTRPLGFVVFGMGKLGGEELNFSSDIDLIYLYERDAGPTTGGNKGTTEPRAFFTQLAQHLTRALSDLISGGRVFRVDLRLRPDGMNGPVVSSLPNALLYYESWGQTWERAALLKARPIAGDKALGAQFLHDVSPFVFRRYLDYSTVEDISEMKTRVERALRSKERSTGNVKLGRGGIREIEFVVQASQLIYAGKDPQVRERTTLKALDRLVDGKYLTAADRDTLRDAYRFLRHVEHKLQIVQDRQTHTLPQDEAGMRALARRVDTFGVLSPKPQASSPQSPTSDVLPPTEVAAFQSSLRAHMDAVHQIFCAVLKTEEKERGEEEQKYDPEGAALLQEIHNEERTLRRLQQLGFKNLTESYQHLQLLRNGPPHSPASPKRRKILYELAPALVHEVARAADPDRALACMAELIASIGARSSFLSLLSKNPSTLHTLVGLFGTSEYLSQVFLRRPALLDSLVRTDLVQVHKARTTMQEELTQRLTEVGDFEDQLDILRRYRTEELLRIGINDSNGLLDVTEVSAQLSDLAESCLVAAYGVAHAALQQQLGYTELPGRLAIVGMGKLGAGELNYNSDLDLIFLYEPTDPEVSANGLSVHEVFTKLAQRLISVLQVQTREGYVYKIDTRLRPSGHAGSLVSSLAAFARYHETSSQLWERQALIKARVVVGEAPLVQQIEAMRERYAYTQEITAKDVGEIDRLRNRMEQELARESADRFNIKTGRGGIVDIEFLVQMLQLRYGQQIPALRQRATLPALTALHAHGVLSTDDLQILTQGYRFLRTLENRLRIDRDQPVEALENEDEQLVPLARRLGYVGDDVAAHLLADYHRHREAVRACYTRRFDQEKQKAAVH